MARRPYSACLCACRRRRRGSRRPPDVDVAPAPPGPTRHPQRSALCARTHSPSQAEATAATPAQTRGSQGRTLRAGRRRVGKLRNAPSIRARDGGGEAASRRCRTSLPVPCGDHLSCQHNQVSEVAVNRLLSPRRQVWSIGFRARPVGAPGQARRRLSMAAIMRLLQRRRSTKVQSSIACIGFITVSLLLVVRRTEAYTRLDECACLLTPSLKLKDVVADTFRSHNL